MTKSEDETVSEHQINIGKQDDASIFRGTMVEMTWPDIQKSAENGDIVLFPVGTIEEHGPHMDLSPDAYLAHQYCLLLQQSLREKNISSIIAPPYYWGVCEDVKSYPGTFSLRPETMKAVLTDLFTSLDSWGFHRVFIINAHGDRKHVQAIEDAAEALRTGKNMQIYLLDKLDVFVENPPAFPAPRLGRFVPDIHAGAVETSAMYLFYPQKVRVEIAQQLKPQKGFHPMGYLGDPKSFLLEETTADFYQADLALDACKIAAFLSRLQAE